MKQNFVSLLGSKLFLNSIKQETDINTLISYLGLEDATDAVSQN